MVGWAMLRSLTRHSRLILGLNSVVNLVMLAGMFAICNGVVNVTEK